MRHLLLRHVLRHRRRHTHPAAAATALGVNPLYARLPSYVLIMGGGAIVNLSYCFIRLAALKRISLRADLAQPRPILFKNAALAATGGIMWYLQFFFYAWGEANIPAAPLLRQLDAAHEHLRPLRRPRRPRPRRVERRSQPPRRLLWAGILVIIAAANLVGLGMAAS